MPKPKYSIFKAIADPTRREIIHLMIVASAALSINEISQHFPATRQAVTKHLNILKDAGLITFRQQGREKFCQANPKPLQEVYQWVSYYSKFWDQKLQSLEGFLDSDKNKST